VYVEDVDRALTAVLGVLRRFRLAYWALGVRLRLARHGMRFALEAPHGVVLAGLPTLEIESFDARGGSFRLVMGRRAWVGPGVEILLRAGTDNLLEIGEGTRLSGGPHLKLAGGEIRIGPNCRVRDFVVLKSSGSLILRGRNLVSFGSVIHCEDSVDIGEGAGLAENVSIVDSEHLMEGQALSWSEVPIETAPILVGRNAAIFGGAMVTMGSTLGPGCVVAPGSVVRGEHPADTVLAGVPARGVKRAG
jgi:acetyltransferase-like isoleucine patch superfamily enzyme